MALRVQVPAKSNGRPGYVRASSAIRPRLICSIDAHEKSGKTHFGLTAPGPIACVQTDEGLEGVIQKFQTEKEIYVADAKFDIQDLRRKLSLDEDAARARSVWDYIKQHYFIGLEQPEIRSVLVDTGTEWWEICRLAAFGKLDQVKSHHYGPVNREWRTLIRAAFEHDKHVIFLHKMREIWVNEKSTGKFERKGQADMGYLVQVCGELWKDTKVDRLTGKAPGIPDRYNLTISECRHNPELEGLTLSGADCTFSALAALVLYGDPDRRGEFE
jgi:hypothetical protein